MHLISPNDRVGRKIDHSRNKSFYCRICGAGFDKSGEWKKHVLDVQNVFKHEMLYVQTYCF